MPYLVAQLGLAARTHSVALPSQPSSDDVAITVHRRSQRKPSDTHTHNTHRHTHTHIHTHRHTYNTHTQNAHTHTENTRRTHTQAGSRHMRAHTPTGVGARSTVRTLTHSRTHASTSTHARTDARTHPSGSTAPKAKYLMKSAVTLLVLRSHRLERA